MHGNGGRWRNLSQVSCRLDSKYHGEGGMALLSVLVVILVLALLGGLVLYLSGQESQLSTVRYRAAQTLNIAEGGAWAARAALMAVLNADPIDTSTLDVQLSSVLEGWYADGQASRQDPLALFRYVRVGQSGQDLGVPPGRYDWLVFAVDWPRDRLLKLRFVRAGSGTPPSDPLAGGLGFPANALGEGRYRAAVVLTKRAQPHESCRPFGTGASCYVHRVAPAGFAIPLRYRIVSDGEVTPAFRRRVALEGDFRVVAGRRTFADWAMFMHGSGERFRYLARKRPFFWRDEIDGPVHTNEVFAFSGFPKFGGREDPCVPERIRATPLTSTGTQAWFLRRGASSPGDERLLEANEWVQDGQRVAAPVLPDCTPDNYDDDLDNPAAWFQRGYDADPTQPGSQPIVLAPDTPDPLWVALGGNPSASRRRWWERPLSRDEYNRLVRQAVPELPDNQDNLPWGIYLPVQDVNGNGRSDDGEPLSGGIFVHGDLHALVMSNCPPGSPGYPYCPASRGDRAYYHLVHRVTGQTVTVVVDRGAQTTTVTNSAWPEPRTRIFAGVPKGYQGTTEYPDATVIYVAGKIGGPDEPIRDGLLGGLWGQVEEREQVLVVGGKIFIPNHLRYERPPGDSRGQPGNVLGVWVIEGKVWFPLMRWQANWEAPENLEIHGFLMVGRPGTPPAEEELGQMSDQCTRDNPGRDMGRLRVLGGLIAPLLPVVHCNTDPVITGYSLYVVHDRRMGPGFAPPYFPVTSLAHMQFRSEGLAGSRPTWREGSFPASGTPTTGAVGLEVSR